MIHMWNRNVVLKYTDQNYMISRRSYDLRTTVAFLQMYGGAVIIITAFGKHKPIKIGLEET